MHHAEEAEIFHRIKELVQRRYGERLISLAVFGSYATGSFQADSDLDLLVVASPLPEGRGKRRDEWMELEREWNGPFLSPVFYTPDELANGSPLFLNMTLGEVVILVDQGELLKKYLDELRGRLNAMGALRRGTGKSSYWIMGPQRGSEIRL